MRKAAQDRVLDIGHRTRYAVLLRLGQPTRFDRVGNIPAASDKTVRICRFGESETAQSFRPCTEAEEEHGTWRMLHQHMILTDDAGVDIDEQTLSSSTACHARPLSWSRKSRT